MSSRRGATHGPGLTVGNANSRIKNGLDAVTSGLSLDQDAAVAQADSVKAKSFLLAAFAAPDRWRCSSGG